VRAACLAAAVTAAGCFSPGPLPGLPCSDDLRCPAGQTCDVTATPPTCDPIADAPAGAGDAPAAPDATSNAIDAAPGAVGCADGEREAFVDRVAYPTIAGCAATWFGTLSLRQPSIGLPCGDDGTGCVTPASACALGWHICGVDGTIAELLVVSGAQCAAAGPGRFVAALSHCATNQGPGCPYTEPFPCYPTGWCAEAACCGTDCLPLASFGCNDGVWMDATTGTNLDGIGCGAVPSTEQDGVLCCAG
jgi:hypothetical protein